MTYMSTIMRMAAVPALLLAGATTQALAGEAGSEIVVGRKFSIESTILQERREFLVYTPALYDDELYARVRYPVMYVLDGEDHFNAAAGMAHFMSEANAQIPQQIIVAIINTDRARDLTPVPSNVDMAGKVHSEFDTTGGADRFLQFLEKELIPRIENDYRTVPHRTFVGHSFGGLAVLHSLLSQPGLFRGYIAIDPSLWWQDQFMVGRVRDRPLAVSGLGARVFMALADHRVTGEYDGTTMIVSNMRFAELLQDTKLPILDLKLRHFAGEDHGSVPFPALYYGLIHVFDGYKVGTAFALKDSPAELMAHFRAISDRFGFEVRPPESLVDQYAQAAYGYLRNPGLAIEYATLNVANYPTSSHALSSLARLEMATGEPQKARKHYLEALRLSPQNNEAREALASLESNN